MWVQQIIGTKGPKNATAKGLISVKMGHVYEIEWLEIRWYAPYLFPLSSFIDLFKDLAEFLCLLRHFVVFPITSDSLSAW